VRLSYQAIQPGHQHFCNVSAHKEKGAEDQPAAGFASSTKLYFPGTFQFEAGQTNRVLVESAGANGVVNVDAVRSCQTKLNDSLALDA